MILTTFKHRLYGRTRGRSNKNINITKYYKLIDKYRFSKFNVSKSYILDIGTGYGETSLYLGKNFQKEIIISCEKFIDGNLSLIKNIEKEKIYNINVYPGNANELLDNTNKYGYFSCVWIYFPDPWPKKRHFKRRLVTSYFLEKLYKFLKTNAEIVIATDSISYSKFILNAIFKVKNLYTCINLEKLHLIPKDYYKLETKYYKKAIISGRKPILFILKKI